MKKKLFSNSHQRQSDVKKMHKAIKSSDSKGQKRGYAKWKNVFVVHFLTVFEKRKSLAGKIAIFTSIPLE